jgi:hypothetical protein
MRSRFAVATSSETCATPRPNVHPGARSEPRDPRRVPAVPGLLDGGDETASLAGTLLSHPGVKVLLLSATPYKMYTIREELEDDHYADLLRTIRFLAGPDETVPGSPRISGVPARAASASDRPRRRGRGQGQIEQQLRRYMVRTERLAASRTAAGC